jgi:hypothetical protein
MNLRFSVGLMIFGAAAVHPVNAQQISAPGWNQKTAPQGQLLFEHVSGEGIVAVNTTQSIPYDRIEEVLRSALADLDHSGRCPGGRYATIAPAMEQTAWQAQSFGETVKCLVLVRPIDTRKMYYIVATDRGSEEAATNQFAWDLLYGLSGVKKTAQDRDAAEQAASSGVDPPVVRPKTIPKSNKIIAVFFDNTRQQTNWTPGLNTMVQSTEFFVDTEVLFADGTACKDCLEDWTNDPSLKAYRTGSPNDIGKWTKVSGGFSIRYPDSDAAVIKSAADNVKPVLAGKRFNNYTLESVNGSTVGTGFSLTQNVRTDIIFLGADGRFSWGFDGTSFRENLAGGYNSNTGEYVGANHPSKGPTVSGRYSVSDYGIKLEYDGGKSEVLSLLTFADEPDFLVIDGMAFVPKKAE